MASPESGMSGPLGNKCLTHCRRWGWGGGSSRARRVNEQDSEEHLLCHPPDPIMASFFAQQHQRIGPESALSRYPGGNQTQQQHGQNYARKHEWIARSRLVNDVRKQPDRKNVV